MKASLHTGRKWSAKHNLRTYDPDKWNKDDHIDPERSALNEVLTNVPLQEFFEQTFGAAIEQYNNKNRQKHPDRVTTVADYYKQHKGDVQEAIIQLGNHEDYWRMVEQYGQDRADKFHADALRKQFEDWQERNPSLRVFSAVIHMDEVEHGTPHLHLDYLPVAENSRGLTVKISMDGAMQALGYKRTKGQKYAETPYKQWLEAYRAANEAAFQELLTAEFGNTYTVEPAEHTAKHKHHQEAWEYAIEQKRSELGALVAAAEVSETRTVKTLGVTWQKPKTADELEQDKTIQAAKAILQRESEINQKEIALREKQKAVESLQEKLQQRLAEATVERDKAIEAQQTAQEDAQRHIEETEKQLKIDYDNKFQIANDNMKNAYQRELHRQIAPYQDAELKRLQQRWQNHGKTIANAATRITEREVNDHERDNNDLAHH